MLFPIQANGQAGDFHVRIVNGRRKTSEEWARELTDRLLSVADTTPVPLRDQAVAFKAEMFRIINNYLDAAMKHERDWVISQK